jgi:hypothetical protein
VYYDDPWWLLDMYHVGHVMYMRGSSAKIDDFVENFEEC